jgi:hypothetical protein
MSAQIHLISERREGGLLVPPPFLLEVSNPVETRKVLVEIMLQARSKPE